MNWICSVCGKSRPYIGSASKLLDNRFILAYCRDSTYPTHKRAYGIIDGHSGPVIFYQEGMKFSEQPEQTDPEVLKFVKEKKSGNKSQASSTPKPRQDRPREVQSNPTVEGRPIATRRPTGI